MKMLLKWLIYGLAALGALSVYQKAFGAEIVPCSGVYSIGEGSARLLGAAVYPDLNAGGFEIGGEVDYIWSGSGIVRYGFQTRYDFLDGQDFVPYTIGGAGIVEIRGGPVYGVAYFGAGLVARGETINFYIEERLDEWSIGSEPETHASTVLGIGKVF